MKYRMCVKRVTAFVMTAALGITAFMPVDLYAETLTNDVIKQSEEEKKSAESSKAALKKGLTDVKQLIADLQSAKGELENYIIKLDEDLSMVEDNIKVLEEQLAFKQEEIEKTKLALEDAIWQGQQQYGLMKKRIQFVYEKGQTSNIDKILSSSSFVEFLNRAEYVSQLSEYDRKMLDKYIETTQNITDIKAELEVEEKELDEAHKDLESEQEALEELIAAKENQIVAYQTDINNKEAAIKEYEAEIAAQDEIIKTLENRIAEERRKLQEQNKSTRTYDGGMFKFPCPNYTRISDDYGMRMHPILKVEKFHNGVDLAAPSGSPILAAYDGDVVSAGYSSSMGNYIMIDHGDSLITIYMHASSLNVSTGQSVSKGQKIGAVGSTGRSTGPHLHFSVRKDGNYVSPWNYIK
ncbi:MAG: peptidoglycan DD-metalloendopeptidase family protein [Lachnospiraceae bacterium]|nr:peptidoglycan DD-metalloendopeptidase family protein [Lachnospiraceae bacterium]MBR6485577.1 peptidoglycan DD-metalloendopeptidase family protein [Lachnospiraceae bacterium]